MSEPGEGYVKQAESTVSPEERVASWRQDFSDPTVHDMMNFTYLVHGLADNVQRSLQALALIDIGADVKKAPQIDLERDPLRVAEKPILSTSVIDWEHRSTWGDAGLILRVPPENIVNIHPSDAGTPFYDSSIATSLKSHDLACTVGELLEQTSPRSYNEVIVQGTTDTGKVEVAGFFIKIFNDNSLVNEELSKGVIRQAYGNKLPFVQIFDSSSRQPQSYHNRLKSGLPTNLELVSKDLDK